MFWYKIYLRGEWIKNVKAKNAKDARQKAREDLIAAGYSKLEIAHMKIYIGAGS